MSYYNDFLNPKDLEYMQKAKNRTGEVVKMTPEEYYESCAKDIFNVTVDHLMKSRKVDETLIDKYKDAMKSGDVFPLCSIDYANKTQEGLHRMLAAGEEFGWDIKYPVLVVTVFDKKWEEERQLFSDALDYVDYYFKDDVKKVEDMICNEFDPWNDEPPMDLYTMIQNCMSKVTDGKVEVEITPEIKTDEDLGDYCLLHIKPISYSGVNISENRNVTETLNLDDMFNVDYDTFNPNYYF